MMQVLALHGSLPCRNYPLCGPLAFRRKAQAMPVIEQGMPVIEQVVEQEWRKPRPRERRCPPRDQVVSFQIFVEILRSKVLISMLSYRYLPARRDESEP